MAKAVKRTSVAVLSILNIAVGVFLIQAVNNLVKHRPIKQRQEWKRNIDEVYIQYTSNERKNENTGFKGSTDGTSPSPEFLSLLKPVAHFSGLDFEQDLKDDRNKRCQIRNWANSEGSERTLLYNDMTYQDGSITVPVAGVYHITSHVKFYVEDNQKDDNSSQTFHHQIIRYSASSQKQVVLFENVVTECREGINDGAHLEYPSLAGGLAQLDAGDQVIVKVSHFDLLKHDRDWHYFDIYLV